MVEITYRLPPMHDGQRAVFRHPARFKWLAAGRRWRKTTLALRVALTQAARGAAVLWCAPTYRQCQIGWKEMERAAGGTASFHKGDMRITVPPLDGTVEFISLDDPDNARGKTADGVIIDEAGYCPESAWYNVLRPMLSDTNGWALICGTPNGRNWFWREHMTAQERTDSMAWQVPTLGVAVEGERLQRKPHPLENPHFPFQEAETMFATMPQRVFQQEFLAEFVDDAGLVFRYVRARSTAKPQERVEGHRYVVGVDWARAYDWTVISVIDATTKTQVAIDRFNQIDYVFQTERLKAVADRYKPDVILAEENAMGAPLIDQLRRQRLPIRGFTTTSASKEEIIQALALALERGDLTLLNHETQINELQAFGLQRLPSGTFRYSAPEGMHDDTVIALALAWHAVGHANRRLVTW